MNNFSLIEKLNILMDIIKSSPLFLFSILIGLILLIVYIICIKKNYKINKWIFISIWILLFLIILIYYHKIVFSLIDSVYDAFFMALYFPSIPIYISMLVICNGVFIYSLIKKDNTKINKIINFINILIEDILMLFTINIIQTNGIDINDSINMYTNSNFLVLLEISMAIFASWILIKLFILLYTKLKKYDKIENIDLPEIIFEEF